MICKNCGNEILENHKFCPNCGTPVDGASQIKNEKTMEPPQVQQPNDSKKTMLIISWVAAAVAVVVIIIIVILGKGKTSDKGTTNQEIDAQTEIKITTTEAPTEEVLTEAPTEEVTEAPKKELSDDDFESFGYMYCNSIGTYYYYLIVTNKSETAVQVDAVANAYDVEENRIAMDKNNIDVLGPGEQSIMKLWFPDTENIDHVEYTLSYKTDIYYEPVIANLSYDIIENEKNVILDVTNNGNKEAEFVMAYAITFDANGNIIEVRDSYIVDDDSEIKAGATVSNDIRLFHTYDHVEIYFTGRHMNW